MTCSQVTGLNAKVGVSGGLGIFSSRVRKGRVGDARAERGNGYKVVVNCIWFKELQTGG